MPSLLLKRVLPRSNAATIKLLGFFEEKYGYDELPSSYTVATEKTETASPTLRAVSHPDIVLVRRWVENWKKTGFLQ